MSRLVHLLAEGAGHDCEYGIGLSNHLPMALVALSRLGAPDLRLDDFARRYAARLPAAPAPAVWPAGDAWRPPLGRREAWPIYRDLFTQWLEADGVRETLAQALPALFEGVGAAAFHGLIRTAHAVEAASKSELADALAYWACRWLPLDGTPPERDDGLIVQRMQAASADPGFNALIEPIEIGEGTLEDLAREAAALYAASGDFAALHLVTSAHAVRVLLPFVDEPLDAVADYAVAWTAGRAAATLTPGDPAPLQPWAMLVETAIASDDEHVIKLVHSGLELERAYGGEVWQRAASRVVAVARPG